MKRAALSLLGTFLLVASSGCCCGLFHGGGYGGGCSPCGANYAPSPCSTGGCSPFGPGAYATGSTMSAAIGTPTYAAAPALAPTAGLNPLPTY